MQSAREEVRDLERVRYVTENYEQLQGLRNVPLGMMVLLTGIITLSPFILSPFGPVINEVFLYPMFAVLIATVPLYFVIGDYYERRFGWVQTFSLNRKQAIAVATLMTVLIVVGSVNLMFQPPIHMIWLVLGISLTAVYWRERRFRMHYVIVGVLIVVASFLPVLGITVVSLSYEAGGVVLFLGILFVVCGIFDHLLLVRTMKRLPEQSNEVSKRYTEE